MELETKIRLLGAFTFLALAVVILAAVYLGAPPPLDFLKRWVWAPPPLLIPWQVSSLGLEALVYFLLDVLVILVALVSFSDAFKGNKLMGAMRAVLALLFLASPIMSLVRMFVVSVLLPLCASLLVMKTAALLAGALLGPRPPPLPLPPPQRLPQPVRPREVESVHVVRRGLYDTMTGLAIVGSEYYACPRRGDHVYSPATVEAIRARYGRAVCPFCPGFPELVRKRR